MDIYRPETKQAKKERLRERAAARAEGKEDAPTKVCIRFRCVNCNMMFNILSFF